MKPYRRPENALHRNEIKIMKSRFITSITQVETVEDARLFIKDIRKEYSDANHHVYAFCIGYGNSIIEGSSDDGEPAGTAGMPTLTVLRGRDLGDTVIVTTRYFGGKKLGTGGLVKAYTLSATEALDSLKTEVKAEKTSLKITISYSQYELVKRHLNEYTLTLDNETFDTHVILEITILDAELHDLQESLVEMTAGTVQIDILNQHFT